MLLDRWRRSPAAGVAVVGRTPTLSRFLGTPAVFARDAALSGRGSAISNRSRA